MDQIVSKLEIVGGRRMGTGKEWRKQIWLSWEHAAVMAVAKCRGKADCGSDVSPWTCDLTGKDRELVNRGNACETLVLEMEIQGCSRRHSSSRQMALPMTASPRKACL